MLLRTPGHTCGNQTLFLNTDSGVWGVSENGTCADSWSPMDSRIPGLRALCRKQGVDVVLNANTLERAADQYTSMVLERTVVDRVKRAPAFVQMFPSSEITPSALSPGLKPTILHRDLSHGHGYGHGHGHGHETTGPRARGGILHALDGRLRNV